MSREIKFKVRLNEKSANPGMCIIVIPWEFKAWDKVDLNTISQFTGLLDSVANPIFEGDLLKYSKDDGVILEVFYHDHEARFKCSRAHWKKNRCGGFIPDITSPNLKVIGNIFYNPELLEGEE